MLGSAPVNGQATDRRRRSEERRGSSQARASDGVAGEAGGAQGEVALLGQAGGHPGRALVALACGEGVTRQLEQVPPHRLEPMGVRHASVRIERPEHRQASAWPIDHGQRDRAIERDNRPG